MKDYTVVLRAPDYISDTNESRICLAFAANPTRAVVMAQVQAANADDVDAPADYAVDAVFEGHHENLWVDVL